MGEPVLFIGVENVPNWIITQPDSRRREIID
jgi:hypothetical protein